MKMLVLILPHSLEYDLLQMLSDLGVTAFARTSSKGLPGTSVHSSGWSWHNSMITAAVEDEQADRVVQRLRTFRDLLARRGQGDKVPLRLFAFPCDDCLI